jgi:tRNA A-37 threonylcarbamoyl transferase component Bud32
MMVLVSGENFAGRANEDFGQVKPVLQALLTCLLKLHNAGIVHGDVKPRNIVRTGGISSFLYRLSHPSTASADHISFSSETLQFSAD